MIVNNICTRCKGSLVGCPYEDGDRTFCDEMDGYNKAYNLGRTDTIKEMEEYVNEQQKTIDELNTRIRQLEFQNSMLLGNLENIKKTKEQELKRKDDQIIVITKELESLEHRYDALAETIGVCHGNS